MLVPQSCPTLCNPMDCSLPGSSVHENSQARILEWVAIPFSRRPSWLRAWTLVSCTAGRFWTTREAVSSPRCYAWKAFSLSCTLVIIVREWAKGLKGFATKQSQLKALFLCSLPEAAVYSMRLCRWTLKSPASAASQGASPSPGKWNTHGGGPRTSQCQRSSSARRTWLASCPWPW